MDQDLSNSTSTLYNIEPIGIGTDYCESITSYLVRLSELHLIKPGDLINRVIAPLLKKEYLTQSAIYGGNRFFDGAKTLNGVSKNSFDIVDALEKLTFRNDLLNLTLQKWNPVFSCRGLLKGSLSWCPNCLEEFNADLGFYYYPLIWFMQPVKCCIKHNILLVGECFYCKKKVPVLHRRSNNGRCPYCGEVLSQAELTRIDDSEIEKERYIVENIGKLIEFSENLEYKLNRGIICLKLRQIDEFYRKELQKSLLAILGVPKVTFYDWLRGESIPTLESITNICYSIGISLFEFFFEDALNPSITTKKISRKTPSNKRRKLDYIQLEETLISYLNKDIPMSMEAIAKEISVSKRTLYRLFPVKCKELSKKHQDLIKLRSKERKNEVIQLIDKSIKELTEHGERISQKNIENHLSANALIREKFAKEYLDKILENF